MLAFMRKYQKYFYAVITFVIVISFSFFGTYSTLSGNSIHEQIAFTTVTGHDVPRSDLEEMVVFISTDKEDKKLFGGMWGPNFLNDGVIQKDFLQSGLGSQLIEAYSSYLQQDVKHRFAKELRYQPYTHTQAPYLSSKNVWGYFAAPLLLNYETLIQAKDPLSSEAINARIQLYLAERRFPAPYLRQFLLMQEKQNRSLAHDESLDYLDFSLFGYHTLDDWFGPRFNRLMAEFIFNAADIAEEQGYRVSKEEAWASLIRNAETSFQENSQNPRIGVSNASEYLNQQLLWMRMDKTKAIKTWQKVLLFRRLFNDVGQSVFVDALPYHMFDSHANEVLIGELFRLPLPLRFSDFQTFQHLEIYLDNVSKRTKEEKENLLLPTQFLSIEEIEKKAPELVNKRYTIEMSSISYKELSAKVSVKETLKWELEENNWAILKKEFPDLGLKPANSSEMRLASLDKLDSMTRSRVDQFARIQIVKNNPEWIEKGLAQATSRQKTIQIPKKGPVPLFTGLKNGEDLIKRFDKAEPGKESASLTKLTFDGETFYNIKVLEPSSDWEILTFDEANKTAVLDDLLKRALEIAYVQLRNQNPETYQRNDKSWKTLEEVQEQVALSYFKKQLSTIKTYLTNRVDKEKYQNLEGAKLAPYRFAAFAEKLQKQLQQKPDKAKEFIQAENGSSDNYKDQFKWQKSPLNISHRNTQALPDSSSFFDLKPASWSPVMIFPNGDLYFAYINDRKQEDHSQTQIQEQISRARFLLGNEAKQAYLYTLLPELKEKKGISFDYLNTESSSIEPDNV